MKKPVTLAGLMILALFVCLTGANLRPNSAEADPVAGVPTDISESIDPITMVCDGQDYSVVMAYVTDGNGDPVADGTTVHFVADEPGSVDPFDATTIDGTAITSISGLSGVTTDLNVTATAGDAEDSTSVECVDAMPPGDVNCSGGVSMVDAMLIAQKVSGLITQFPCGVQ